MTIDAASANDLKKIEKAARTEMLDVSRFPLLKFESTAIRQTAPDRFEVSGLAGTKDEMTFAFVLVERNNKAS
jgi:polyisoprenoid-binding protein YceI